MLNAATNLRKGIEPPEAQNGSAYRLRSVAAVLSRDVEFEEGSKDLMFAQV